jgi:hypothetical protein
MKCPVAPESRNAGGKVPRPLLAAVIIEAGLAGDLLRKVNPLSTFR